MNIFNEQHLDILSVFNKHEVKFLLIGGYAVISHGYPRTTGDMDLWLQPSNKNKAQVHSALLEYGIEAVDLERLLSLDFTQAIAFSIGTEPQKIDFLTKVNLVDFDESYAHKLIITFDDIPIPIVRLQDLILMKMNTGRSKDAADIEELQRVNRIE